MVPGPSQALQRLHGRISETQRAVRAQGRFYRPHAPLRITIQFHLVRLLPREQLLSQLMYRDHEVSHRQIRATRVFGYCRRHAYAKHD